MKNMPPCATTYQCDGHTDADRVGLFCLPRYHSNQGCCGFVQSITPQLEDEMMAYAYKKQEIWKVRSPILCSRLTCYWHEDRPQAPPACLLLLPMYNILQILLKPEQQETEMSTGQEILHFNWILASTFRQCKRLSCATVMLQELEADEGLEYLDSGWADTRDLKRTLNGVGAIRLM